MKFILTAFLFLLLSSCSNDRDNMARQGKKETQKLLIDNASGKYLEELDGNVVKRVEIIPLQTLENSLIPENPRQVVLTVNRIFIVDVGRSNVVWIFKADGKFVNKIYPQGEGPGEFSSARAISIDTFENKIEIFASFKRSILSYDFDGNFLEERPIQWFYDNKIFLSNGTECMHILEASMNTLNAEVIFHTKDNEIKSFFQKKGDDPLYRYGTSIMLNSVFESEGKIFCYQAFNDTIFQILNQTVLAHRIIKFRKNPIPDDLVSMVNQTGRSPHEIARSKGFAFINGYYYENNSYVYFNYTTGGNWFFYLHDNKQNRKLLNTSFIRIPQLGLPLPSPSYYLRNGVATLLSPSLKEMIVSTLSKEEQSKISPELLNVFADMDDEDNPILITITFNE